MDGCFTLKDKRSVLRSLIERTRRQFQVSVAEVDQNELWNVASVGFATISNNSAHAESILQGIVDRLDAMPEVCVESAEKQIVRL